MNNGCHGYLVYMQLSGAIYSEKKRILNSVLIS